MSVDAGEVNLWEQGAQTSNTHSQPKCVKPEDMGFAWTRKKNKEKLNIVLYFDFIIIYLLYLLGLVFIIFYPPLFSSKFSNFSQTFVVNRGDDSSLYTVHFQLFTNIDILNFMSESPYNTQICSTLSV